MAVAATERCRVWPKTAATQSFTFHHLLPYKPFPQRLVPPIPILHFTSPHSISLCFVHFPLYHFCALILDNFSLYFRLFTSLLTLEFGILTRMNLKVSLVSTQLNKLTLHQQNVIFHSQRNVVIATITCTVTVLNLACSSSCRYVLHRISKSSNRAERPDNERLF